MLEGLPQVIAHAEYLLWVVIIAGQEINTHMLATLTDLPHVLAIPDIVGLLLGMEQEVFLR